MTLATLTTTLVVTTTACRLHFDPERDGGSDGPTVEGRTITLPCNTATLLTPIVRAGAPSVSAAATDTSLAAIWRTDAATIAAVVAHLDAVDQVTVTTATEDVLASSVLQGSATLASNGATFLLASSPVGSMMTIGQLFDATLTQRVGAPFAPALTITHPRAATALRASGFDYALAGRNDAGTTTVFGLRPDGTAGLQTAGTYERQAVVALDDQVLVVGSSSTQNCRAEIVDLDTATVGAAVPFGTGGQCTEAIAAHGVGRGDLLAIRHDTIDVDANHQIGTFVGTTLSLPGESRLATPANEPRAVAVTDGYWTTVEATGMLIVVRVDLAGVIGTPFALGPVAAIDAHDVVVRGDVAYAMWLTTDGAQVARLCP